MNTIDEAVIKVIKYYAHSQIGTVAVLSEEIGGLVLVGTWIPVSKLGPPIEFQPPSVPKMKGKKK